MGGPKRLDVRSNQSLKSVTKIKNLKLKWNRQLKIKFIKLRRSWVDLGVWDKTDFWTPAFSIRFPGFIAKGEGILSYLKRPSLLKLAAVGGRRLHTYNYSCLSRQSGSPAQAVRKWYTIRHAQLTANCKHWDSGCSLYWSFLVMPSDVITHLNLKWGLCSVGVCPSLSCSCSQ